MDKSIEDLTKIIIKNKAKIITISESSHWSYTSHTFFFKLVKKLYEKNIINTFTSERLGFLDAILINAWLDGDLDCDIDELFNSLPFGGLGTYRWIKYFKGKKNFHIVPSEVDFSESFDDKKLMKDLKRLLKLLLSKDFYDTLKLEPSKPDNKKYIKNKYDEAVYNALYETYLYKKNKNNPDYRYIVWYNNLKDAYDKYKNVFVCGYHLSLGRTNEDTIIKTLKQDYNNILTIGLAARRFEHPYMELSKNFLKSNNLTIQDYINNEVKFLDAFYNYYLKNMKNYKKHLRGVNVDSEMKSKYIKIFNLNGNNFIKNHKDYEIINTKKESGNIYAEGAVPIPVIKGYEDDNDNIDDNIDDNNPNSIKNYDYVVILPLSRFEFDMRL